MKFIDICKNVVRNIQYLMFHRLAFEEKYQDYRLKDEIIEDIVYQLDDDKKALKNIDILDEEATIDLLMKHPKSYCRMGDGEIGLMNGIDQPFQVYNKRLAEKLLYILENYQKDMYVGINRAYFHGMAGWSDENRRYYRLYGTEFRRFFLKHCNPLNTYIDAGYTASYFRYDDNYDFETHYKKMKLLFKDKKIVIVSGTGVLEKLDYDVFELAISKKHIKAPARHAYSQYDQIIEEIKQTVDKRELICMILGMAGKAMVRDLTDLGYMVWDIGHMAKDYDVYMKGIEKTHENTRAFYEPD